MRASCGCSRTQRPECARCAGDGVLLHTCHSCAGVGSLRACTAIEITNPLTARSLQVELELEGLLELGAAVVVEDEERAIHHQTGLPWLSRRWLLDLRPCVLGLLAALEISPAESVAVGSRGVLEWGWLLRQIPLAHVALGEGLERSLSEEELVELGRSGLAQSFAGEGGAEGVLRVSMRPTGTLAELARDLADAAAGAGYGLGLGVGESPEGEVGPQVVLVSQAEDPRDIQVVAELASGSEWRPVLVSGWDRLPGTLAQLAAGE